MFFILYYKRERFKEEGCGSEVFFEWAIIDNQVLSWDGMFVRSGRVTEVHENTKNH